MLTTLCAKQMEDLKFELDVDDDNDETDDKRDRIAQIKMSGKRVTCQNRTNQPPQMLEPIIGAVVDIHVSVIAYVAHGHIARLQAKWRATKALRTHLQYGWLPQCLQTGMSARSSAAAMPETAALKAELGPLMHFASLWVRQHDARSANALCQSPRSVWSPGGAWSTLRR